MNLRARVLFAAVFVSGLMLVRPPLAHGQMSAEKELKTLRAADDLEVSLFAAEPLITNPAAIDVDSKGRVWVAEIQWYRKASKSGAKDKIKVLEDTDGDGRADKVTVFASDVLCPMSICVAGAKVYVATSPDLWVYEDKDGDLKADGPPKKLLTGFGGHNSDHAAHSLTLGPDHKWWLTQGDTGYDVRGRDGSHIQSRWGAVARGEMDGTGLETVATNFRNPYEVCVNSFGEAFISDNDNDGNQSCRIAWILEGGDYGWFGVPGQRAAAGVPYGEHWHFRGQIPGFVPATLVTGFGAPCGICFNESAALGEKYHNAPLHADAGPRECRVYPHQRSGAGYKATESVFLTTDGDPYFRPTDVCVAPDGSLYVPDWYDGAVGGHAYDNPDQGRIFRVAPRGKKLVRREKPGPYANVPDAIEGLKSPNLATQYLARERLLSDPVASAPALKLLLADADLNNRARALWVLDRIGGSARREVVAQLKSQQTEFRALAVRILRRHGERYATDILPLASDPSPEVVREVLLAIRTLPGPQAMEALVKIARTYDGSDRYLLEAINIAAAQRKTDLYDALATTGQLSVQQFALLELLNPSKATDLLTTKLSDVSTDAATARTLLTAAGSVISPDAGKSLLRWLTSSAAAPELRQLAMESVAANLSGTWHSLHQDRDLNRAFRSLLADKNLQLPALKAIAAHGITRVAPDVGSMARLESVSPALRAHAIATLVQISPNVALQVLRKLVDDPEESVRRAALNGLVDLQDKKTIRAVLDGKDYSPEMKIATIARLMNSSGGALSLLKQIDSNQLPAELKALAISKAAVHPDSNVRVLYEKYLPADQRPKRLGEAIRAAEILKLKGNPARGATIFSQSSAAQCKNCHAVDGVGGTLGPDLSLIGKKYERGALLETILEPSKAIAPEYTPYLCETTLGRVYAGFVMEKNKNEVVLKDADSKLIRVPAAEVEKLAPQTKSIMPELVLRDVTAQDAADLLAYLTTLKQGVQNVTKFRILGPLDGEEKFGAIDLVEQRIGKPSLGEGYQGALGVRHHWRPIMNDSALGFVGVDTETFDKKINMPSANVVHYLLSYANSPLDQQARLLIGSDGACQAWVNGQRVHQFSDKREHQAAQDDVPVNLHKGSNVIVLKLLSRGGPGRASLAVKADTAVELKTE